MLFTNIGIKTVSIPLKNLRKALVDGEATVKDSHDVPYFLVNLNFKQAENAKETAFILETYEYFRKAHVISLFKRIDSKGKVFYNSAKYVDRVEPNFVYKNSIICQIFAPLIEEDEQTIVLLQTSKDMEVFSEICTKNYPLNGDIEEGKIMKNEDFTRVFLKVNDYEGKPLK